VNFTHLSYREPGDYYGLDRLSLVLRDANGTGFQVNASTWASAPANYSQRLPANSSITQTITQDLVFDSATLVQHTPLLLNASYVYEAWLVVTRASPYPLGVEVDMVSGDVEEGSGLLSPLFTPQHQSVAGCLYGVERSDGESWITVFIGCAVGLCLFSYTVLRVVAALKSGATRIPKGAKIMVESDEEAALTGRSNSRNKRRA
jgi:hypothetical protein